jgi:hypothetical protein
MRLASLAQVLLVLGVVASCIITYGLALVVRVSPWYEPQYLIPMLGMLAGECGALPRRVQCGTRRPADAPPALVSARDCRWSPPRRQRLFGGRRRPLHHPGRDVGG